MYPKFAAIQRPVLATSSPLGEILASPRAVELESIAPCLLDGHDSVRFGRWPQRGAHPDGPVGTDHFSWAVCRRMHARDPRWEQRKGVIQLDL